jgi:hypothetical protein
MSQNTQPPRRPSSGPRSTGAPSASAPSGKPLVNENTEKAAPAEKPLVNESVEKAAPDNKFPAADNRVEEESPEVRERREKIEAATQPKEPMNYEEAMKALSDAREENRRTLATNQALRQSLQQAQDSSSKWKAETDTLDEEITKLKDALAHSSGAMPPTSLQARPNYNGPSMKDVYLSIVEGMFAHQNVNALNDATVKNMAQSAIGIAELFYHAAIRRPSFHSTQEKI